MEGQLNKEERIEIRVSPKDKEIFKQAQKLSGDKTISGFIVRTQAENIIQEKESILASNRDRKIFFDAVYGNMESNENLVTAAKKYKTKAVSK